MSEKPLLSQEVFQLNAVEGGLRPGTVSFKTLSMDSDHFVCVRDQQPDGQTSLAVADLERRTSERHNIKEAEAAIMNPASRILALRSGNTLQVFNLENKGRLATFVMPEPVVYWCWIDVATIALVTASSVFHWPATVDGQPPAKMFDRGADMDSSVQILSYKTDEKKKWLMLSGVMRTADGALAGKTQLHSVENGGSKVLEGHAGTFVSMSTPNDPRISNIMCLAWSNATGGHLLIMELPTGEKVDPSIERKHLNVQFSSAQDFPVALHVSAQYKLLTLVTSRGVALLVDVISGLTVCTEQVTQHVVFCGVGYRKTGGLLCVNNQGSVFHVSINPNSIVKYVQHQLGNPELALRIASGANLSGADDLFRAQLNNMLLQGNIDGAVSICAKAPNNVLRTPETLARFAQIPALPGQPPAISTYFKSMLAIGKLTSTESVELAKVVLAKGGTPYIKQQFEEDKLEVSEALGDLLAAQDPETAMKMYYKIEAHHKVVNVLLTRNEAQKAVAYCKRVNYSPDWNVVLANFIRVNPQDAVALALMLHNDMGASPVIDPVKIVDMFLVGQNVQQATEFLSEILFGRDLEENARLQTLLLEINLKHSHPSVAEKIFAKNFCSHFDALTIAPLCERVQLHQRAIECYMKAATQNDDVQMLPNIRRCLAQGQVFNPEWLIDFFGKLGRTESLQCLEDLLKNSKQHMKVIVQVATKYNDALGSANLINMFLEVRAYDILYYYLGSIVPYTRDPEVHFRYIEAATEVGQIAEVERMTRESPCYEADRTFNYLKQKELPDLWPLINVCDQHNLISDMVKYLLDTDHKQYIEQFVQRRNPGRTPAVIGALIDCGSSEEYIKTILVAAGAMCPIEGLIDAVEERGRLKMLLPWLEARKAERKTDAALHNALAKVYIDLDMKAKEFLETNEFYEPLVIGKYCENRDPNLSYVAYKRGNCHREVIEITTRNGMWKQLARHLVQQQDLELWRAVLADDTPGRKSLVEAVQQSALPEAQNPEEVSVTVRAFMNADMTGALTSLLDQIVVHGRFRRNRFLENLLLMSAIRARKDKVMEYVNTLQDYDAKDIATIATGAELHEVAFVVYDKYDFKKEAIAVLLHDLKDLPRARSYAAAADKPQVWTALAQALLQSDDVHEAIEALIRAKNPDFVAEVAAAADRVNQFGDLIKYLTMARAESKNKDNKIDTFLVLTYAKTGRLAELEDFLKTTHSVQVMQVADKCFADGLYDSARVLYTAASNFPKLASTLIKLKNLAAAVEIAGKALSTRTWKEVNLACLDAGEYKLAHICAVNVAVQAEELSGLIDLYETAGLWEELVSILRDASNNAGTNMGLFTDLGVLYAKYKPEKLADHVRQFAKKVNTHKLISVCEQYHHWNVVRILTINNEDWLAAAHCMMEHSADAWEHEVFKDVLSHLGSSDVLYGGITFYVQNHPERLHDLLTHLTKRLDPERVMNEVTKHTGIALIRQFLEATQDRNIKRVNDALNQLYVEEEDFAALRRSVESFSNFDSADLSARLEKMDIFEFRKIALALHRRNKRYSHAIEAAKANELYQDAIETAAESKDADLVQKLLEFFVHAKLQDCFVACLYTCYDFIEPWKALQLAWMGRMTDAVFPFMIQSMQEQSERIARLEKSMSDAQKAAKEGAAGANGQGGAPHAPLMIQGPAGFAPPLGGYAPQF